MFYFLFSYSITFSVGNGHCIIVAPNKTLVLTCAQLFSVQVFNLFLRFQCHYEMSFIFSRFCFDFRPDNFSLFPFRIIQNEAENGKSVSLWVCQ